jgi:hypothetical protein
MIRCGEIIVVGQPKRRRARTHFLKYQRDDTECTIKIFYDEDKQKRIFFLR